jgi:hypothetical protein
MTRLTTKSLAAIERRMEDASSDPVRRRILQCAKNFKESWIDLGQALYSAWRDKLYKEWGYITFEAYTAREIGIKKPTAMKLLKSYYFLEKEEPVALDRDRQKDSSVASLPSYESVNVLRIAKNRRDIGEEDYNALKADVFRSGKEAGEVRKSLAAIIRSRQEPDPEEARDKRRSATLKRLLANMKAIKSEAEASKLLSAATLKDVSRLITSIESEIARSRSER